ncbi:monocarboxylate transporter 5-like [Mercenaria mercenaria]|uniref:monocarboxylate transporter 5-like n=1 Tax=Mercenaria mercenaria TaxID=6596 RepID=UPI00234E40AE|nr:monocarboxylate transporter 5-like [Mercenaria mercenaria]XP_045210170.2 monocarboxylate transporter 5-like [Mercenaria mercenaria]
MEKNVSDCCNEKPFENTLDNNLQADLNDIEENTDGVDIFVSKEENDGIPKDGGWAWFVLLGASLEMFLLVGIVKSSGILFVAFQERFSSSSSVTSLLSTVQNICQSVIALLVMTCGIKFTTCRALLFVGSIITCIAYIITSQATDIRLLLFSHGVLQGVGAGFMQPTALTMVSLYFEKRRGLANSIAVSGGPVGGLLFAPLITKLLSAYGYQGCVLVLAGILLNGCVSGALFRPILFYKQHKINEDGQEMQTLFPFEDTVDNKPIIETLNTNGIEDTAQMGHTPVISVSEHIEIRSCSATHNFQTNTEEQGLGSYGADYLPQEEKRSPVLNEHIKSEPYNHAVFCSSKIANMSDLKSSHLNISSLENNISRKTKPYQSIGEDAFSENCVRETEVNGNGQGEAMRVRDDKIKAVLHNLSESCNIKLLTNPVFYAFLIQGSLICSGTVVAPIFIAPYAKDIGETIEDAATLVTTQSCVDLFSRIIIGYISDKGWLRRSTIVAIATMIVSLSSSLLRFYTNYTMLLGYSIVLGLVSGVYFSLFPVILIDYLTLANFQTCLGFMALVHGFSVAGAFYLVGYLRDISGSYVIPHHVIGAATGVGTIILFLLPKIQRRLQ